MATEKKFTWFSQDFLSRLLNYAAFIIIFGVTICFIVIASWKSCKSSKVMHANSEIKRIEFVAIPKLESNKSVIVSAELFKELKATTDSINKNIKKFEEIKSEVVAIEERNKDDMKFYLTVLGSIIAIVGFFGFKSINDTRESSIKFATDEAKSVAKTIATEEAKDAIKIQHQDWTNSIAELKKNYDDILISLGPIGEMQTDLVGLRIKIERLEKLPDPADATDETTEEKNTPAEETKTPDPETGIKDIDTEDKFDI